MGVVLHKKGNILGCVSHRYARDIQGRYLWLYNYMAVYNGMLYKLEFMSKSSVYAPVSLVITR